jgi:hypothetical protein
MICRGINSFKEVSYAIYSDGALNIYPLVIEKPGNMHVTGFNK